MLNLLKSVCAVSFVVLLEACGVDVPNPARYDVACTNFPVGAELAESRFFYVSTRVPDCRRTPLRFTGYRAIQLRYGRAGTSVGDRPWRDGANGIYPADIDWLNKLEEYTVHHPDQPVLVYVHGFYNGYGDAFERAFKLSLLIKGDGPVIVFDWASRDTLAGYPVDEGTVLWAQDRFNTFLADLVARNPNIVLVSHSMGNRLTINGVRYLEQIKDGNAAHVTRMVLASPDYDRAMAQETALEQLAVNGRQVVVYASSKDHAIGASTRVHGYEMLGSTRCAHDIDYDASQRKPPETCYLVPDRKGLAVVDTSDVSAGGVGHTDFIDSCAVVADLRAFLAGQTHMDWRVEQKLPRPSGPDLTGYVITRELARESGTWPGKWPCTTPGRSGS